MKNVFLATILICVLCAPVSFADVLYLKNHSTLTGKITKFENSSVTIEIDSNELLVNLDQIDRIQYDQPDSSRPTLPAEAAVLDESLYTNLLTSLISPIATGSFAVNCGVTWAFTSFFQFNLIDSLQYQPSGSLLRNDLQSGVLFNPFGSYFRGPFVGTVAIFSASSNMALPIAFALMPEAGFQWSFDSGLFVGALVGYSYQLFPMLIGTMEYGLNLGISYSLNKKYKIMDLAQKR